MSAQLLSSKIVIQEDEPQARNIQSPASAVLACLGITERGPVDKSTLLFSYEDFTRVFGNDVGIGYAALAMRAFFEGGGQQAYFSRVVHHDGDGKTSHAGSVTLSSGTGEPSPAQVTGTIIGPYGLVSGATLIITVDEETAATATFTAAAAVITGSTAQAFVLANGQTLSLRVNGGALRTISFLASAFVDITIATAVEVIAVINAAVGSELVATANGSHHIVLTSKVKGTSSSLEIVSGTAAALLGFSTGIATGTGNVSDISVVTVAEIKTIVEAAVDNVTVTDFGGAVKITGTLTGDDGLLLVGAGSTADDELGLDNLSHTGLTGVAQPTLKIDAKYDGIYSNSISLYISAATSGVAAEFNLVVLLRGSPVETFPNLTMFNGAERHVEKIVNAIDTTGSKYIQATDLRLAPGEVNAIVERPANSTGSPLVAFGPLSGGNDGLTDLSEADFTGDSALKTGFFAFDRDSDIELLICPEVASPAVHNAALSYCSVTRNGEVFFIADPPAGLTPQGIVTYVTTTAAIKNSTEHGAIYWPRVKILNPNPALYGTGPTIVVPPSGYIAGMFARVDNSKRGGIYLPPGGVRRGQLPNVLGFESDEVLEEAVRDFIAPNLINPITRHRGQPIAVDDVMTLRANGPFPTIAERRGVTFIERAIKDGLQFARLENNDETLRSSIRKTVRLFLIGEMKVGAFRTQDPATAFFIDCGDALNPPSEQFAGRVNTRIGLATQKPARWVIFTFAQDTRALDQELAAAG